MILVVCAAIFFVQILCGNQISELTAPRSCPPQRQLILIVCAELYQHFFVGSVPVRILCKGHVLEPVPMTNFEYKMVSIVCRGICSLFVFRLY